MSRKSSIDDSAELPAQRRAVEVELMQLIERERQRHNR